MPRSRGSEMPQKQSSRGPLRGSSSDSELLHRGPVTDKSSKLGDRRSPRGAQSDPLKQKKLGTRIADLESQLGQAQKELKILKEQLTSAEASKKEAQEQLEKKTRKLSAPDVVEVEDKYPPTEVQESNKTDDNNPHEIPDDNQCETDVFEVPMEKVSVERKVEFSEQIDQEDGEEAKPISMLTESLETQKPTFDDLALKNDEINLLKAKLDEKQKELEAFHQENRSLKGQLNEAATEISTGQAKEQEMTSRLSQLELDLEDSRANEVKLKEKLEAVEGAKEASETEMKKLRVHTEQWRKAADAAATVLAGGMEMNGGRRISERCGSMDKQFGSVFEPSVGGYGGFVGSPGMGDDSDDGFGRGKRKGSGIRMFGDLWKKKGQK